MTIKDIVKTSALCLGRERVVKYLENQTQNAPEDVLKDVDLLTRCVNLIISEMACTYFPVTKRETVETENGKVYFSDLTERILETVGVYDLSGNKVKYGFDPEYITVSLPTVVIEYRYMPSNLDLTDSVAFDDKRVGESLTAFGAVAEFCLAEKNFDESVTFRKRFTDSVSLLVSPKSFRLKEREWI